MSKVRAGEKVYLLAPGLNNATNKPLRILSVSLAEQPKTITFLGAASYAYRDEVGAVTSWDRDVGAFGNPEKLDPRPLVGQVLPPRSTLPNYRFPMITIRVNDPSPTTFRGLRVTYRWQGETHTQTVWWKWKINTE